VKILNLLLLLLSVGMALAQELSPEQLAERALIREKSQEAFDFLPLTYDPVTGKAPIQVVDPARRFFLHEGSRYFGFRFKAPEQIDGDFGWMYLLKPKSGPVQLGQHHWSILRKNGPMNETYRTERGKVADYPELAAQFPYTRGVILQMFRAEHFVPGEEYAIWFRFAESERMPEFAIAFSFAPRTKAWTARLPTGRKRVEPTSSTPTSIEGDPW
jgi:hypothetical protein